MLDAYAPAEPGFSAGAFSAPVDDRVVSKTLLWLGMRWRYPAAAFLAYGVFLGLVRLWLWYVAGLGTRRRSRDFEPDLPELLTEIAWQGLMAAGMHQGLLKLPRCTVERTWVALAGTLLLAFALGWSLQVYCPGARLLSQAAACAVGP